MTAAITPVPAHVLHTRALNKARRDAADAKQRAETAYREYVAADHHLHQLEAEPHATDKDHQ